MYRMLVFTALGFSSLGCLNESPNPHQNLEDAYKNAQTGEDEPTAPTQPVVTILPSNPTAADNLNCMVTLPSDSQIDTVLYAVSWNENQAPTEITSATVNHDATEPGSEWSCVVTASLSNHPELSTDSVPATVLVQAAGPSEPTIEIQPATPDESDNLLCVLKEPSEGDGTISYQYQWTLDDNPTTNTTPVLLADQTQASENWSCTVTPFDEEGVVGTAATEATLILDPGTR